MSKTYTNPSKVQRIKEPLLQVNRTKYRNARESEKENAETNLLKLDLTRIEAQLDAVDTSILEDLTLFVGDKSDIDTTVLLNDGLSYSISDVAARIESAPSILKTAPLWLDSSLSTIAGGKMSNLGRSGSILDATLGSSTGSDSNDPTVLSYNGVDYLYLPGTGTNYAHMESSPALNIVGDIELEVIFETPPDWTVNATGNNVLIAKELTSHRAYCLRRVTGALTIQFVWSTDGSTASILTCTAPVPSSTNAIKVVHDVDNGSGGNTAIFYISSDYGANYSMLGSAVGGGTTSHFRGIAPLTVGYGSVSGQLEAAGYRRAIVRDGINGTVVADINFSNGITSGSESCVPVTGTVTSLPHVPQCLKNLGTAGSVLDARFGSTGAIDTNDPFLAPHSGTNYLMVPDNAVIGSNFASIPASAALDAIVNDFEIVIRYRLDGLTGAADNTLITRGYAGQFFVSSNASTIVVDCNPGGVRQTRSVAYNLEVGNVHWIKVTRSNSTGQITIYRADDQVNEPTSWSTVGSVSGAAGALVASTGVDMKFGANSIVGLYRCIVRSVIDTPASTVVDVDFTTGITSGAQSSFVCTTGQTVTFTRAATGRKTAAVVRDVLLFGTDDYLEIVNDPLVNFGAADSFTVLTVSREWNVAVSTILMSKKATIGAPNSNVGWMLLRHTDGRTRGTISDGTTLMSNHFAAAAGVAGTLSVSAYVRNVASDNLTVYGGVSAGTPETDGTTGSLTNSDSVLIGYRSSTGSVSDNEFFGAAIFRRALSASEIALINAHYTGSVTAESTALLKSAVFWVDAKDSAIHQASIVRSSAGKKAVAVAKKTLLLGVDDYLEIPDNDLLDVTANQSLTALVVFRTWPTPTSFGSFMSKQTSINNTTAGWQIYANPGVAIGAVEISDATTASFNNDVMAYTSGNIVVMGLVLDRSTKTLSGILNNVRTSALSVASVGSLSNSSTLRIGQRPSSQELEFFAAAVFRRPLTTSEIAEIVSYYNNQTSTISIDTLPKIGGRLSRMIKKIQRLEMRK